MEPSDASCDVLIVGAGAAGLATAIFTRLRNPSAAVVLLDGARRPGAKILVSGGGRCNVTNTVVTERDYWGGPASRVRQVLRALPVAETIRFFRRAGVTLHEEHDGKLFPDSNSARQVLDALLTQAATSGVDLRTLHRVSSVRRSNGRFVVAASGGEITAARVVLATGGQSLPKTGSDGAGFGIARALGLNIVPTTPALAPLLLAPPQEGTAGSAMHAALSGVAVDAELTLWIDGRVHIRLQEALLWTHFGISGPVALNLSRHWLRARLDGRPAGVTVNFVPGTTFDGAEQFWMDEARSRPRTTIATLLSRRVPVSLASALLARLDLDGATTLADLTRDSRRRLSRALTAWPLPVSDSRGYNYAEATAGGVDLNEVDPATMESRRCPGLHVVGEVLDVDGRLGGFNFQWAWSSAAAAASRLSR